MQQRRGRLPAVLTIIAVALWAAAASTTAFAMRQPLTSPTRSSLVLADIWLLTGAMTTTISLTVVVAAERHRRVFFEYGYLSAIADHKAAARAVSISTLGSYRHADELSPQQSGNDR